MAETFGLIVKYAIVEQSCTRHPVLFVDIVPQMIREGAQKNTVLVVFYY